MTVVTDVRRRLDPGLTAVLAELPFPAPVWLLVAQAQSFGVDAERVEKLSHLPSRDYRDLEDVAYALDAVSRDWADTKAALAAHPAPATIPDRKPTSRRRSRKRPIPSRAAQHKIVGEGLAVGLLALGVEAITINEALVESAFERAWRNWTGRSRFPAVRTGSTGTDIVGIVRSSARRRGPHIADWGHEGQYVPRLCVEGSLDDAARAVGEPVGVIHVQWLELARGFAAGLNQDLGEIRYRDPASPTTNEGTRP